jgi:hypothetical protein
MRIERWSFIRSSQPGIREKVHYLKNNAPHRQNYPPEALNFTLHEQRHINTGVERSTVHRKTNAIDLAPTLERVRSDPQSVTLTRLTERQTQT